MQARLCLRGGFQCFGRIARAMGFDVPFEANPDAGITLTFEEFLDAVARLNDVGFKMTRDPADAWPDFVGWRINYEQAAYRSRRPSTRCPRYGRDLATRWNRFRRSGRPSVLRGSAAAEHVNDLSLIPWLCWGA